NQISFDWLTPDSPEIATRWPGVRPPDEDCPMLLAEGAVLGRPSAGELARVLGLQTRARFGEYDTVIIGGGPAGLPAAGYAFPPGFLGLVVYPRTPRGDQRT